MKKLVLLLTLIFSQAQACLANSAEITKDKPVTWREYCDSKIAKVKQEINNSVTWIKHNPKATISILTLSTIALIQTYRLNLKSKEKLVKYLKNLEAKIEQLEPKIEEKDQAIAELKKLLARALSQIYKLLKEEFKYLNPNFTDVSNDASRLAFNKIFVNYETDLVRLRCNRNAFVANDDWIYSLNQTSKTI